MPPSPPHRPVSPGRLDVLTMSLAVGMGLALAVAGCDDGGVAMETGRATAASVAPVAAPREAVEGDAALITPRRAVPMPGGGLRVDLGGEAHHVRGLERQPDGTYKNVCADAPGGLKPRLLRAPGAAP
jgi:hypothetical protein